LDLPITAASLGTTQSSLQVLFDNKLCHCRTFSGIYVRDIVHSAYQYFPMSTFLHQHQYTLYANNFICSSTLQNSLH